LELILLVECDSLAKLDLVDETDELSNGILQIYNAFAPGSLGRVILDSTLKRYDPKLAAALLNAACVTLTPEEAQGCRFALAVVNIDLGAEQAAREAIGQIGDRDLEEVCTKYCALLPPAVADSRRSFLLLLLSYSPLFPCSLAPSLF
jgi:hypothetical protein